MNLKIKLDYSMQFSNDIFLRITGVSLKFLILGFIFLLTYTTQAQNEGGYGNKFSVLPGDSIEFHISTSINLFDIKIIRLDSQKRLIQTFTSIKGGLRITPDSASILGCNWPISFAMTIDSNWTPGLYSAEFPTSEGNKEIVFNVKAKYPGEFSKIVVEIPINDWQAYNLFGGYDFYQSPFQNLPQGYNLSFERPYKQDKGFGEYFYWASHLVSWLDKENIKVEFTDNKEIDKDTNLLRNYKEVIIAGHDEYVTRTERRNLTNYVNDGGKLVIFGGNTCWIQVRYLNNQKTIVCFRKYQNDPYSGKIDSLVTVEWRQYPVNFPENSLTGVSWANAGYVNSNNKIKPFLPWSEGYGGYTAMNTYNWIYDGTNLNDGEIFGYPEAIVGNETDGALYQWIRGIPKVIGTDMTPKNFIILGISPAANWDNYSTYGRQATMGMYFTKNNGAVFNASTLRWCNGLDSSFAVQLITKNVIKRFLSNKFPPEITSWRPFRIQADSINQERIFINKRSVAIPSGKSMKFSVRAKDLFDEPLNYKWTLNGNTISTDTAFMFIPDSSNHIEKNLITVYVFNAHDTSTIRWNIFTKPIKIVSNPPKKSFAPKERFYYRIESSDFYQDTVKYKLISAPNGLNLNQEGVLSGVIIKKGIYQVSVRADDSFNNFDIQNFTITIDSVISNIDSVQVQTPSSYALFQNYPNPFNPSTIIRFKTTESGVVNLKVYDILGREVIVLLNEFKSAGNYDVKFNAINLASGIYFYALRSNNFFAIKKMSLIK